MIHLVHKIKIFVCHIITNCPMNHDGVLLVEPYPIIQFSYDELASGTT